jgi:hypothetical protein
MSLNKQPERREPMLGLLIKDEIRWHDQWSTEFGRRFQIHDFTDNLIIFEEGQSREEILAVIGNADKDIYELFELEDAPPDSCDFMVASGRCYNRKTL